jgi:AcrR family transcriptional regulator
MPTYRSGAGDPATTLELLWRHESERPAKRGPRPGLSVDRIVEAAIELADRYRLDAVTMRRVADRLGVAPMTLYTYVPGKAELIDLMLDDLYAGMPRPDHSDLSWRDRVEAVAHANRTMFAAHPWAAQVATTRPPLGPGQLAKYEYELRAFDGTSLDDVERDAALTFVLQFVRAIALSAAEVQAAHDESALDDQQWWEVHGPLLARFLDETAYPTAARVGSAAGAAHGAAYSDEHAYEFGLRRVLDGLASLIDGAG